MVVTGELFLRQLSGPFITFCTISTVWHLKRHLLREIWVAWEKRTYTVG